VRKSAIVLWLFAVMTCKWSMNPIIQNPVDIAIHITLQYEDPWKTVSRVECAHTNTITYVFQDKNLKKWAKKGILRLYFLGGRL
jgi:hypothetical protein